MSPARSWLPWYVSLALIWGLSFYFIELGLEMFTPVGVAFGRIAFGTITLIIVVAITRSPLPPRWAWKHIFVVSLFWVSTPAMLYAFGQTRVTSATAGIINAATPLMTLLAILIAFPEEKPTRRRIVGLFIGFIGILTVIGVWKLGGENDPLGIAALVAAVACYGIAFPYTRRYLNGPTITQRIDPIGMALVLLLGGLVVTAPIVAITGVVDSPFEPSAFVAILLLGVLGSGLASVLNFKLVAASDATTASTVTYFTPLVAILAGVYLLNETLSWNQPLGALLVVLGAAIAQGVINGRIDPWRKKRIN